ncbi:MAG: pyridoxamine 5'-phosphate oxidase family protein [Anaerolineales bacterium]|nr:pyridoxamine 5'-phosphate oxidase family protein [Anaerolineales bacterium]
MSDERVRPRRQDRTMHSDSRIEAVLHQGQIVYIATSLNDHPYVIPNLYWYDADSQRIYFHTALEGRTRRSVENNPQVCLSVAEMGRLLPADKAIEFSVEYASVCVFGRARVTDSEEEARHGLQGLLDKYFPDRKPGKDYRPITQNEIAQTAVYALEIEAWSGKEKVAQS